MFKFAAALILIAGLIWAGQGEVFRIKAIDCRLNHYPCPLSLEPVLLTFIGRNIFTFSAASASRQMAAFDSTLTGSTINKQLPDRLLIDLSRRLPLALIKLQAEGREYWLDKSGFIYPAAVNPGQPLPVVLWPENLPLVEGESEPGREIAGLINTLTAYYVNFDYLTRLADGSYLVKTVVGAEAVIPDGSDFPARVGSLQFILSNLKIGEPLPVKIDLRFDKPILTY